VVGHRESPTNKPHGRVAYSIHLTDAGSESPYFDVSVMPKLTGDESVVSI